MGVTVTRIGEPCDRVVVVQAEGPAQHRGLRAAVGVVPFVRASQRYLTVVVRLELALDAGGKPLEVAQPRTSLTMSPDTPLSPPDAAGELRYASDFVIAKKALDVLLVGHARGPSPAAAIDGSVQILGAEGPVFRGIFSARASQPAAGLPLRAPYLTAQLAGGGARVGPRPDPRIRCDGRIDGLEPEAFQAADPAWRVPMGSVGPGATVVVRGLFGVAERRFALPGLEPDVTVDVLDTKDHALRMGLDTIWIDADEGIVSMSWRGSLPIGTTSDVHRVVVSMEHAEHHRSVEERLADTQRGLVHFAWTEDDARAKTAPPTEDALLTYHKHMTWNAIAPEPRIPIETYAKVSAQLAEQPEERAEVLARNGFEEERWMVEERAWLERFASNAVEGQGELAAYFGALFVEAQDGLATPDEENLTIVDYAGLRAEIQRSADPKVPLDRAKVTLARYMRMDRRWTTKAQTDPAVAARLDALLIEFGADTSPLGDFEDDE